jgi:hypothetical protein
VSITLRTQAEAVLTSSTRPVQCGAVSRSASMTRMTRRPIQHINSLHLQSHEEAD